MCLVAREAGRVTLEIAHREGAVVNVMTDVSPLRIDLWEDKRRYRGTFINEFEPIPGGTRYTVRADIELKGVAKVLGPILGPYTRRQIRRYVLEPMRRAFG